MRLSYRSRICFRVGSTYGSQAEQQEKTVLNDAQVILQQPLFNIFLNPVVVATMHLQW